MPNNSLPKTLLALPAKAGQLVLNAKFETALLCLLLLTAGAVIWQKQLLERTIRFTPQVAASHSHILFSDHDAGGNSTIHETAPLRFDCDLRAGNPYPYCGYELFIDRDRGTHGLDLSNMHSVTVSLVYTGPSTSFRVHLKNFDPRYGQRADDESPKYLRVETDTAPGKLQQVSFAATDFGVADWWMRKHKLAPEFGRPQFNNITSLIVETGSEAPLGHHTFDVRDITIKTDLLSQAQWYSLLLGLWIVMIVAYLGYRVVNLRRALRERQKLEMIALHEAQEAARRDPLTGLLNRRGLTERVEALIKPQRQPLALAIILIDIDHFKKLNDAYGHDFGDEVLSAFAKVIAGNIRTVDIAARWGGEEFIVVCSGVDRKGAQRIAEKLRACVEAFDFGRCGTVTASFGIHWSYTLNPDLAQAVGFADRALYAAKAGGRNCTRFYRAVMSTAA